MTSETFVFGGHISEKVAIGARVRLYAATLGSGHVEAAVRVNAESIDVFDARAYPLGARDFDIRRDLETLLNG
jgi:hypothetical protein